MADEKAAKGMKVAKGSKAPRKARKKHTRTVIDHMDNHGHTVTQEFTRKGDGEGMFPQHEEKKHAFTDDASMMAHMNSLFGGKGGAEAEVPGGAPEQEEAEAEPEEESEES